MGVIYMIQLPRRCTKPVSRAAVMRRLARRYPSDAPPVLAVVQHRNPYRGEHGVVHMGRPEKVVVLHGGGDSDDGSETGSEVSAAITAAIAASVGDAAVLGPTQDDQWVVPFRTGGVLSLFVHNVSLRGIDVYGGVTMELMAKPPFNITEPPDFPGQLTFSVRVPAHTSPAEYHLALNLLQCIIEELNAITPGGCGRILIKMVREQCARACPTACGLRAVTQILDGRPRPPPPTTTTHDRTRTDARTHRAHDT